jgi:hypothetical protein
LPGNRLNSEFHPEIVGRKPVVRKGKGTILTSPDDPLRVRAFV